MVFNFRTKLKSPKGPKCNVFEMLFFSFTTLTLAAILISIGKFDLIRIQYDMCSFHELKMFKKYANFRE